MKLTDTQLVILPAWRRTRMRAICVASRWIRQPDQSDLDQRKGRQTLNKPGADALKGELENAESRECARLVAFSAAHARRNSLP
jgi:hypothetical protein